MNFKGHLISEIIIFLLLWGFFNQITLSMIILPIFWGSSFPDSDLKFNSHRNFIFHSIIPNFIIFLFNISIENMLFIIAVAIHLIGDIIPMFWKKGGFATIDFFFKRLNTINSMIYMGLNIIGAILIFMVII